MFLEVLIFKPRIDSCRKNLVEWPLVIANFYRDSLMEWGIGRNESNEKDVSLHGNKLRIVFL